MNATMLHAMILRWETPDNMPFPMPIEVVVNGKAQRIEMKNGTGGLHLREPYRYPNGWVSLVANGDKLKPRVQRATRLNQAGPNCLP